MNRFNVKAWLPSGGTLHHHRSVTHIFFVSTLGAPLNPMVLSRSFSLPDSPIGSSVVIQRGKSFPKSLQIKVFMQKPWKKPWKKHGNIL